MPETTRTDARSRRLAAMLARAAERPSASPAPSLERIEAMLRGLGAKGGACPACPECGRPMAWGTSHARGFTRLINLHCDRNGIWSLRCTGCLVLPGKRGRKGLVK